MHLLTRVVVLSLVESGMLSALRSVETLLRFSKSSRIAFAIRKLKILWLSLRSIAGR